MENPQIPSRFFFSVAFFSFSHRFLPVFFGSSGLPPDTFGLAPSAQLKPGLAPQL
jgi:hypothetical protein